MINRPDLAEWERLSEKWCVGCGNRIPDAKRKERPGTKHCDECEPHRAPQHLGGAREH